MKVYHGIVGPPAAIKVKSGNRRSMRSLSKDAVVGWGDGLQPTTNAAFLILVDVLGIDQELRARALLQRFKYRALIDKRPEHPWVMTEDQVRKIVADIEQVEAATAQTRRMVAQEPGPVAFEGGRDIVWDNAPKIDPNDRKKKHA